MKKLLLILLVPVFVHAQKQNTLRPYVNVNVGMYKFKNTTGMFQGSLSFGGHLNDLGIGFGAALTKFRNDESNFMPVFMELNLMPQKRKVSPYANMRLGTSVYSVGPTTARTTGGFYGAIQLGVASPVGNNSRVLFGVGYIRPTFKSEVKIGNQTRRSETTLDGFSVFFGFYI